MPGFEAFLGQVSRPTILAWPIIPAELLGDLALGHKPWDASSISSRSNM
jgi:hypothetical protein